VDFKNEVEALWNQVDQENVKAFADIEGLRKEFLRHHGFGVPDVDYTQALRPDVF